MLNIELDIDGSINELILYLDLYTSDDQEVSEKLVIFDSEGVSDDFKSIFYGIHK